MKLMKLIAVAFIFLILISPVQASFATISQIGLKYGLRFVDPAVSNAVNTVLCVANPVLCVQGMIVGQVLGQAYQEVAKVSPEAAQAISVYNQVEEIVNDGMAIVNDIQMDNKGVIQTAIFQSTDKSTNIDIRNVKIEYDQKAKLNTYIAGTGTGTISFISKVPGQESVTNFRNLKEGSKITAGIDGVIQGADITLTEEGKFTIGDNKELVCQKDSRVVYENGMLKVFSDKDIQYSGKTIKLFDKSISLQGSIAEGNFRLNDVDINGKISIEQDGYLLKSRTLKYNGLILSKNSNKDIFFVNKGSIDYASARAEGYYIDFSKYKISDYFYDSPIFSQYNEYVLVAEDGISLKGNLNARFEEGNQWISMNKNSIFELDSTKGEISLSPARQELTSSVALPSPDSRISFKNGNLNFVFEKKSGKDFMNVIDTNKQEGIEGVRQTISFSSDVFKIDSSNKLTGAKYSPSQGITIREKLENLQEIPYTILDKIVLFFEEPSPRPLEPNKITLEDGTIFYEINEPIVYKNIDDLTGNKIYGKVYSKEKIMSAEGISFYPVRKKSGYDLYYMGADNTPYKATYGISGFELTADALEQIIIKSFGEPIDYSQVVFKNGQPLVAGTNEPVYPRIIEGKQFWFKKP